MQFPLFAVSFAKPQRFLKLLRFGKRILASIGAKGNTIFTNGWTVINDEKVPQSLRLCGCDGTTPLFTTADRVRKTQPQSQRLCGTGIPLVQMNGQ
jgi:hypothetical protein